MMHHLHAHHAGPGPSEGASSDEDSRHLSGQANGSGPTGSHEGVVGSQPARGSWKCFLGEEMPELSREA